MVTVSCQSCMIWSCLHNPEKCSEQPWAVFEPGFLIVINIYFHSYFWGCLILFDNIHEFLLFQAKFPVTLKKWSKYVCACYELQFVERKKSEPAMELADQIFKKIVSNKDSTRSCMCLSRRASTVDTWGFMSRLRTVSTNWGPSVWLNDGGLASKVSE